MLKLNEEVTWTSQAAGSVKTKVGVVVQVVAAGQLPDRDRFARLYTGPGIGAPRKEESYVVKAGGRLYWPRPNALRATGELGPLTIEDRLMSLEGRYGYPGCVPGTILTRVLNKADGAPHQWSLGLGPAHLPKRFFVGASIADVIALAEAAEPPTF